MTQQAHYFETVESESVQSSALISVVGNWGKPGCKGRLVAVRPHASAS